jgi:hypothetical protein
LGLAAFVMVNQRQIVFARGAFSWFLAAAASDRFPDDPPLRRIIVANATISTARIIDSLTARHCGTMRDPRIQIVDTHE